MKDGFHVDAFGNGFWYKDNLLHREDGPAIEALEGDDEWYLNGKQVSEEEVMNRWNAIQEKKSLEQNIDSKKIPNKVKL